MNENQVTCNDAALQGILFGNQSSEPSEELLAHVENCTRCQQRISELAGPAAMWQSVKAAIARTDSSHKRQSFPPVNLDQSSIHWTESMAK